MGESAHLMAMLRIPALFILLLLGCQASTTGARRPASPGAQCRPLFLQSNEREVSIVLSLTTDSEGRVTDVRVVSAPKSPFVSCVVDAWKSERPWFAESAGTWRYTQQFTAD